METNEPTAEFTCRLMLFDVHGCRQNLHQLNLIARVHPDGEGYWDDLVKHIVTMRDTNKLPGDWSTGAILLMVLFDEFLPVRLIKPRAGKMSIFD